MFDPDELGKGRVVWARVVGFPWWPARLSSPPETEGMERTRPSSSRPLIPVTFLGSSLQRGWVSETCIKLFDAESVRSKLRVKTLKTDRAYCEAVIEGIRIESAAGSFFPKDIIDSVEAVQDVNWDREDDVCRICKGTEWSGDSLLCDRCAQGEIHLHCLATPILTPPEGDWYCPTCCKELGLPEDYMPAVKSVTPAPSASSATVKYSKKRPATNGNNCSEEPTSKRSNLLTEVETTVTQEPRRERNQSDSTPIPEPEKAIEYCFVCRTGAGVSSMGRLMSCNFPSCHRTYHPVCVAARLPGPILDSSADISEPWFCPAHFCSACDSLETYRTTPEVFPTQVLATGAHLSGGTELHHCSTCPFSLCLSCVCGVNSQRYRAGSGSGGIGALFRSVTAHTLLTNEVHLPLLAIATASSTKNPRNSKNSRSEIKDGKIKCCLNCALPNPRLALARFLEEIWVEIACNRLADPFLRPLLPGVLDCTKDFTSVHPVPSPSDSTSNSSVSSISTPVSLQNQDMLGLLEKIRSLEYDSHEAFAADISSLRQYLERSLRGALAMQYGSDINSEVEESIVCILQSFDSITHDALHLSYNRRVRLTGVENLKKQYKARASVSAEEHLVSLWRRECEYRMAGDEGDGARSVSRSMSEWCRFIDSAGLCAEPEEQNTSNDASDLQTTFFDESGSEAVDRLLELAAADALAHIHDSTTDYDIKRDDDKAEPIHTAPCGSCFGDNHRHGVYGDALNVIERLHEVTTTALQLQTQLKRDLVSRQTANLHLDGDNYVSEVSFDDMHVLRELKLVNDNLKWKLRRQSMALQKATEMIRSLTTQNDILTNRIYQLSDSKGTV